MKLYHYTSLDHADEIRRSGYIQGGGVPIPDRDGFFAEGLVPRIQWLTNDPVWRQSWATRETISCDRTECRLVVNVPLLERHRLARWDEVSWRFGYTRQIAERFAQIGGGAGSERWYVFFGLIPVDWVTEVEIRPAEAWGLVAG